WRLCMEYHWKNLVHSHDGPGKNASRRHVRDSTRGDVVPCAPTVRRRKPGVECRCTGVERSRSRMKLKLIQTGGFAGLTRTAELDIDQEEAEALVQQLTASAASHQPSPNVRDAFNRVLIVGGQRVPFSPEDMPEALKPTVERLISMLKVDSSQ